MTNATAIQPAAAHATASVDPATAEVLQRIGKPAARGARRWLRLAAGLVVVVVAVAAAVVWRVRATAVVTQHYLTVAIVRGDLASTVTATGNLQGLDTVDVGAEISGKIKALHADFNEAVTAGQVLCEIDPEQLTATRNQVEAQLSAARSEFKSRAATADQARLNATRVKSLATEGLASSQQVESAVADAARAAAAVESAAAQITVSTAALKSAQTSLNKTTIRSPIDGVVLARKVEVGQTVVAAMQTPVLFTLARDLKEMELTVSIDEADIGQVRAGQSATFSVDAYPGKTFPTELRAIHNVAVVRDNVVTYEARLAVKNDDGLLRPGMTATVTIQTEARSDVLLVPNMALRFTPPEPPRKAQFGPPAPTQSAVDTDVRPSLWLEQNAAPVRVRVTTGLTDGEKTEIIGGEVKAGDRAITDVVTPVKGAAKP